MQDRVFFFASSFYLRKREKKSDDSNKRARHRSRDRVGRGFKLPIVLAYESFIIGHAAAAGPMTSWWRAFVVEVMTIALLKKNSLPETCRARKYIYVWNRC